MSSTYRYFRVDFQMLTSARIGDKKIGNLQTTRHYVPGNNVWAAAVVNMVRCAGTDTSGKINPYDHWGEFFKNHLRFSYLFIHSPEKNQILLPHMDRENDNEILCEIESGYIYSLTHTALDHHCRTQKDGSLHELEFISHRPKNGGNGRPTRLMGYVGVEESGEAGNGARILANDDVVRVLFDGGEIDLFRDVLQEIRVGGDRSHGFGQLRMIGHRLETPDFTGIKPIPGHILCKGLPPELVNGPVEAVTGRAFGTSSKRAPGQFSGHFLAHVPGSVGNMDMLEMDCFGRFAAKPA